MAGTKERPPANIWKPYLKDALNYKKVNGSFAGFQRLKWGGEEWYPDNKGKNYSAKAISAKLQEVADRRGKSNNQKLKLSSIEQMMVDNIWRDAVTQGLAVDHTIPIAKGGPTNAPWNLRLMDPKINSSKGDKIGGHWPTIPLTMPYMSKHDLTMRQTAPQGGFTPLPQTTAHGGGGYRPPLTSAKQGVTKLPDLPPISTGNHGDGLVPTVVNSVIDGLKVVAGVVGAITGGMSPGYQAQKEKEKLEQMDIS